MVYYELDDVLKRAIDGDESIKIPSPEDMQNIEKNDYVKLIFIFSDQKKERMWVKITDPCFPFYEGILDNDSEYQPEINCGEKVKFEAQNIVEIIKKD